MCSEYFVTYVPEGSTKYVPITSVTSNRAVTHVQRALRVPDSMELPSDLAASECGPEARGRDRFVSRVLKEPKILETPVSLENLLKIGQLKPHPPEAAEIERLSTAEHCIGEAGRLIEDVAAWRASKRPDLVPQKRRWAIVQRQ